MILHPATFKMWMIAVVVCLLVFNGFIFVLDRTYLKDALLFSAILLAGFIVIGLLIAMVLP